MDTKLILLLIAGYIRKTNHPGETEQQIAAGVIADMKKTRELLKLTDTSDITGKK